MQSFECSICLSLFTDPRVVPCGHTFCLSCLRNIKPPLKCPLCQKPFPSFDQLPSNFIVSQWMQENDNKHIKNDIMCENCESPQKAILWCETCSGTYYCEECDAATHRGRATRNHVRLTLKEKLKKPTLTKCPSHSEENKIYCIECRTLICSMCVIDDHHLHRLVSVYKHTDEIKNELKSMLTIYNELVDHCDKREVELDNEIKNLTSELCRIEVLLKEVRNKKEKVCQQKVKAETSNIVLSRVIEESMVTDLMNQAFVEKVKGKIKNIEEGVCSVEDRKQLEMARLEKDILEKERAEKERLEKERLEKERLEKERLEKERLEKERLEKERLEKERLERLEKENWYALGNLDCTYPGFVPVTRDYLNRYGYKLIQETQNQTLPILSTIAYRNRFIHIADYSYFGIEKNGIGILEGEKMQIASATTVKLNRKITDLNTVPRSRIENSIGLFISTKIVNK